MGFPKPTGVPKQAHNIGYDTVLTAISSHMDTAMAEARNKIAAGTETNHLDLEKKYDHLKGEHAALGSSITFTDKTIVALSKVKQVDKL